MRLRRLRLAVFGMLATGVIVLGVLAGLTHLAMPWLVSHPQSVARWLGERLGRTVAIGRLEGAWYGGGPVLTLREVSIGQRDPAQPPLTLPTAQLAFDLLAPLRRGRAFSEFRIDGLELQLSNEQGQWRLHGLEPGATDATAQEPFSLGALGALELTHARLRIDDAQRDLHLQFGSPALRVLNRGDELRVLARLSPGAASTGMFDVVADVNPATHSGTVYVGSKDVDVAAALGAHAPAGLRVPAGRGLVQAWLQVRQGRVEAVRARLDLREVIVAAADPLPLAPGLAPAPQAAFERLGLAARWLRTDSGWALDVADLVAGAADSAPARLRVQRSGSADDAHWDAAARGLDLEPLGSLAMLASQTPASLRRWLYQAHPRGRLDTLGLRWDGENDFDLRASMRGGEIASAGLVPGVERLDLDVVGDAQAILLQVPLQATTVNLPPVFRRPFVFAQLGGDVVLRRTDDNAWRIETDRVAFEGEGYGGELRGAVELASGRRPFLDLYAVTAHGDVPAAKLFWPLNIMPPTAVAWLDRALVEGRIVDGRVAFRGDLADWPFRNHAGNFVARAEIDDATLDYHPDWPRAQDLHAVAYFINDGMQADASAASAIGNSVQAASATIPSFSDAVLDLAVKGSGSAANLLTFVRATPFGKRYAEPLKDLVIDGRGNVEFKLTLPFDALDALALDGNVKLQARKLDHLRYDQHFSDVSGTLHFTQQGLAAEALDVTYRERPAKLSLDIGSFASDPAHALELRLDGLFPAATVFADAPVLAPVVAHLQGESAWSALVAVGAVDSGAAPIHLTLDSDLVGTTIDLPVPLDKSATARWPLHIALDLPYAGQRVAVRLADLLAISAQLPADDKPFGMRLRFGAADAGMPPAGEILVDGNLPQLDAGAWIELALAGGGTAGAAAHAIDVRGADVVLGGRHFADVRLAIENLAQATRIGIDSAALAGTLDIARGGGAGGIDAHFARVHWPEAPAGKDTASTLAAVAPGSLPPIHLVVDDFRLGTANFGSAQFDSHPIADGMAIERLTTHSPNIEMSGQGEWTGSAAANRSRMTIALRAHDVGRMMDALGYAGLIDGGATRADIDASWPGPPSAFALADLDGSLAINIADGRIPDAKPGAGRIFGLLSITEIPRRLSLDFSDFFKSGLGFNSIEGKFHLADGNAWTDGLRVDSPAAEIIVTGRTGLRARDYDQRLVVEPRAGATLPVVGALAAGPVGAAAGLVAQGLLNKPIGQAVKRQYSVTGSWDKPEFTPITASATDRKPGPVRPKR
ncbi:YhdP family protein [Dokdonella sp.]|uniref:YhdP family protein n=1 Tax=Dokdonella sp. TaxID=2291710 RepID=UPI0025C47E02|nr:YhdP family protein [Dokdonella sp.]